MPHKWFVPVLLTIVLSSSDAYSQVAWTKLFKFPDRIATIYFTNENNGFVSTGIVPGGSLSSVKLFRTRDGGASWKEVYVQYLSSGYGIMDIIMTDDMNGWACGGNSDGHSLWRTNDGGDNWLAVGPADNGLATTIRKTKAGIVIADFNLHSVRLSTDDGATFTYVLKPKDYVLGMDFSDSVHGVVNSDFRSGNPMYYTTDGGLTWKAGSTTTEGWMIYGQKEGTTFFTAPEGYSNTFDLPTKIYRSDDFGKTWNIVSQFSFRMSGAVSGSKNLLYCQTGAVLCPNCNYDGKLGIYRSSDQGVNWTWLGGPDAGNDTRFAIADGPCNTHVIYAPGTDNFVYKAYDLLGATPSKSAATFSSSRIVNDSFNVTIHLPIFVHRSGKLNDVDLIVHYPVTSLELMSATLYNWKTFDVSGGSWPGRTALHIDADDLNAMPDSLLGYLHFRWKPFEFACDEIDFDSLKTTEAPCSDISLTPFSGIIGSYSTCGLSGVEDKRMPSSAFDFSVHPNPAQTTIQIEIAASPGKLQYELFDELGILRKNGLTSENTFSIDLHDYAEGKYYVRIISTSGMPVTKCVVKVK